jgi:hypothetical protein
VTDMTEEMKAAPVALITHGQSNDVEDYVRALARRSGQPCDWGYVGGRAIVHTTGDVARVVSAAIDLAWMEVAMWAASAPSVRRDFSPREDRQIRDRQTNLRGGAQS